MTPLRWAGIVREVVIDGAGMGKKLRVESEELRVKNRGRVKSGIPVPERNDVDVTFAEG